MHTLLRHLLSVTALAAIALPAQRVEAQGNRPDGLYAQIHTNKGRIVARLELDLTPLAVTSFVGLAEGTIENAAFDAGRPFWDGTIYHRVVPGHVIQTGQPRGGRSNGSGYTFPNEIHARLSHNHAGALQMANGGPHTNANQFCITLGDRSYLDGDYIVFGEVVEGMDVVTRIVQNDVVDSVRILRVGAKAQAFHPTTQSFRELVRIAEQRVAEHAPKKRAAEQEWIARNYPIATGPVDSVRTAQLQKGSGVKPAGPVRVRYRGTEVRYQAHMLGYSGPPLEQTAFGSGENGAPGYFTPPREFVYEPGKVRLNPGLESVIAAMTPGEKRIAIVPGELGYGRGGFYGPETPGQPRFAISPFALLVYEIEMLASPAGRTSENE